MATGVVKMFSEAKGFGFIGMEGEPDVFVHYTNILNPSQTLRGGDRVEFEIEEGFKGPEARNVKKV